MGCAIAEAVPIQPDSYPLLNAALQLGLVLKGLTRHDQLEFLGEAGGQGEWGPVRARFYHMWRWPQCPLEILNAALGTGLLGLAGRERGL